MPPIKYCIQNSCCASPPWRFGWVVERVGGDALLRKWDVETGTVTEMMKGHESGVCCMDSLGLTSDNVASGSWDSNIKFWDPRVKFPCLGTIYRAHVGNVMSVCTAPNGRYLASGGSDSICKLWDIRKVAEPVMVNEYRDHVNSISCLGFTKYPGSMSGVCLISGCSDTTLKLWDVECIGKTPSVTGGSCCTIQ